MTKARHLPTAAMSEPETSDVGEALLQDSAVLDVPMMNALREFGGRIDELAPNEELRCKYLSKPCKFKRSLKKVNGAMHNLCVFHRAKAIVNQRRLELRKKNAPQDKPILITKKLRRGKCDNRHHAIRVLKTEETALRRRNYCGIRATKRAPVAKILSISHGSDSGGETHYSPRGVGDFEGEFTIEPPVKSLEPFESPVSLRQEDLETLMELMGVDDMAGPHIYTVDV